MFGIAEARVVALFMESAAWGVQVVTVTICIYTLIGTSRKLNRPLNTPLVAYALVLFGLGTLDIAFAVYRNIQAFIYYEGQGGAAAIFNQLSDYVTVIRVSTLSVSYHYPVSEPIEQNIWKMLALLVADSALVSLLCSCYAIAHNLYLPQIYRSWVIYGRKLGYIIPLMLLWMASLATAVVGVYYTATLEEATSETGAKKVEHFLNAFLVCEVVLNIITTGELFPMLHTTSAHSVSLTAMILYRIHVIHRASARFFSSRSGSTIVSSRMQWPQLSRILVESAFLYTLVNIVVLVVNFAHNNAVYPVADVVCCFIF